ncbi:MAG: hypothetical protein QF600_10530 [Verrucomicrobiota bacterium]|jgi:hypothetical protein|nr:hypothetical protein [Verrucomicrobiota bacterium]
MSEENQNQPKSEGSAFIKESLERAKKGFNSALVISGVLVVVVLGYMWFLTNWVKRDFTLENLSTLGIVYLNDKLDSHAPELISQATNMIPSAIQEQVPEYVSSKIPEVRKSFQTQADHYFTSALDDIKPQVDKSIDEVFSEYKAEIDEYKKKIGDAKSLGAEEQKRLEAEAKDLVTKLTETLIDRLLEVAARRKFDNPSVDKAYRNSLIRLKHVNNDLSKLAAPNEDLDGEDRDLRYAIGLMLDRLEWSTPSHIRKPTKKEPTPAPKKK